MKNTPEEAVESLLKNKNLKYFTSDSQGNILNISKNLEELLNKTRWKKLELVN